MTGDRGSRLRLTGGVGSAAAGHSGPVGPVGPVERPADGPVHLLREHLERERTRIEERRRELAVARDLLARLEEVAAAPRDGALEPLSPAVAPAVVTSLLRRTRGLLRSYVLALDVGPGLDASAVAENRRRIEAGHEQRTIYPASVLSSPEHLRWLRDWADVGEVQRVVARTSTDFAVFGTTAAVGLTRWGDVRSGYALIRDPALVAALTAYFDLAWEHSAPVPGSSSGGPEERLVGLLAAGLKDEAIARVLGVGLRTVRRRVAALMADHGVSTRFQLGAALASGELVPAAAGPRPDGRSGTRPLPGRRAGPRSARR
jgi:hypothetical protein